MATPTAIEQERDRIQGIISLCERHRVAKATREQLISSGASLQSTERQILEAERQKHAQRETFGTGLPGSIGLNGKQQRQYSLCKAILAQVTGDWSDAGFEREISQQLGKTMKRSTNGFFFPLLDLSFEIDQQRATYAVGASATGGVTVATDVSGDIIEFLRNRSLVLRMGARELSGLSGNLNVPRQNSTANTYWVGEGGTVSQSEATFDDVKFRPKTVGLKSRMTRLMLLQSSTDIESFVRQDLAASLATEIDRVAINGTGTANQPAGLLNSSMGTQTVSLGANGGALTWTAITQMETALSTANADVGSIGWLLNPYIRGKLKTTLKNPTAANSDWIWESGTDPLMGQVNGYSAGVTNHLPANLTKGTGTNLSALIFGDWSSLIFANWSSGLEVLASPFGAGYDSGDIEVRGLQSVDLQVRHPESFVKILDAVTA
jgi:HK97 family phage major capsid protein